MKYYLYAKTIADEKQKIKEDVFKNISDIIKMNYLFTTQKFIGCGFSKILSDDESSGKLADISQKLIKAGIKSAIVSEQELEERKKRIFDVSIIEEFDDRFKLTDVKGSDHYLDVNSTIIIIGGVDGINTGSSDIKKLALHEAFVYYIYSCSSNVIFKMDNRTVNYSKLKGASKYSKIENMKKIMNAFKKNENGYYEDFFFSLKYIPGMSDNFLRYTALSSILFDRGLQNFEYDKNVYDENYKAPDKHDVYDFKYNIYRPNDYRMNKKTVKRFSLMKMFFIPFSAFAFALLIFVRLGLLNFTFIISFSLFVYYAYQFIKVFRMKLFFESIPFSNIKSMSVGLNEIKGTVIDKNAIPSPISGTKSVYFKYEKYQKVKEHEGDVKWELVEIGEYIPESIFIENDGSEIEVKTENASIDLHSKMEYYKTYYDFFTADNSSDIKYTEELLPVSEELFVIGSAVYHDKDKSLEKYIKNKKSDKNYMNSFDRNNDKFIDAEEWENAKNNMESEFHEKDSKKQDYENLNISYTKDDGILFISDLSEKKAINGFKLFLISSGAMMALLLLLTIISVWR